MNIYKSATSAAKKHAGSVNSTLTKLTCCQLLLLVFAATVSAQSLLDTTFNGSGKATTQIVSINSKANDSILQPDGKIIVVGSATTNAPQSYQIAVARYNTNGSLDATFDGDGKLTTTVDANKPSAASAVALQPDGKIVVVGRVGDLPSAGSPDAVIVRYNPDGSLDATFDGDGIRLIANFDAQNAYDAASDVAVQADGKIVIAAGTIASGFQGFVVARLNADGAFDASFGTGGYTRTQLDNQTIAAPKLALTADGKILLTGDAVGAKLIRYNSNGTLDGSFGSGAIINNAGGDSIRLDANGKIVTVNNTSQVNTVVRRYNADGSTDATFGVNGAATITFTNANGSGNFNNPYDLAIQPDGKIVVGGTIRLETAASRDFALARLNANGSIDSLFAFNGRLTTDIQGEDIGHSILIQPDGKIVLAGESGGGFTVARFVPSVLNNVCRPISDFDGDGKSDLAYFNNSGEWKHINSAGGGGTVFWGLNTDRLVPGDYNGDCRTDYAVFRDGNWYIRTAGINSTQIYYRFGQSGDIPVPGDYDGDDLTDPAVFRNGVWYISGTRSGFYAVQFGLGTDQPVAGDYDGDGKTDIAVNRSGNWYIQRSQQGFTAVSFGDGADKLVPADYDGDGKTDVAVFRPSTGNWYIQRSQAGFVGVAFGLGSDVPVPADYDGDGKADIAVYRNGSWYFLQTASGYTTAMFGSATDKPIQSFSNP